MNKIIALRCGLTAQVWNKTQILIAGMDNGDGDNIPTVAFVITLTQQQLEDMLNLFKNV